MSLRALLLPSLLAVAGCRSSRGNDTLPYVQPSTDGTPAITVTVTARGNFSPPCVAVALGDTVEWYNPTGQPINVTTAALHGQSPEIYSPNLVGSAARWRHAFATAGRYDYFNQGASTGGVVDPYYGTRVGTGTATTAQGTVCVRASDGSGCDNLCCLKGTTCANGHACEVTTTDPTIAFGFCATTGSTAPPDAATAPVDGPGTD